MTVAQIAITPVLAPLDLLAVAAHPPVTLAQVLVIHFIDQEEAILKSQDMLYQDATQDIIHTIVTHIAPLTIAIIKSHTTLITTDPAVVTAITQAHLMNTSAAHTEAVHIEDLSEETVTIVQERLSEGEVKIEEFIQPRDILEDTQRGAEREFHTGERTESTTTIQDTVTHAKHVKNTRTGESDIIVYKLC